MIVMIMIVIIIMTTTSSLLRFTAMRAGPVSFTAKVLLFRTTVVLLSEGDQINQQA